MLRPPEHVFRQCQEVLRKLTRGDIDAETACDRLLAIDSDYPPAYLQLAQLRVSQGRLEEAEAAAWKGLALWPAQANFYLPLADIYRQQDPAGPLMKAFQHLAFRKFGVAEKIAPGVADLLRHQFGSDPKVDFSKPAAFEALAAVFEKELGDEPPEVAHRVLPYRLLTDLQYEAPETVSDDLLDDILDNKSRTAPVLLAAIREWAMHPEALSPKAVVMAAAILGEIGDFDVIHDLLELSREKDWVFFLHTHWALCRLGQRFPTQSLDAFRQSAKGADSHWRCAMAEHISLLPEEPGIAPALLEMLKDFPPPGKSDEAADLLAIVHYGLGELGLDDEAEKVLEHYEPLLARPARKWLQNALTSDQGFVPRLVAEDLDALDITDVVIDRMLMDDEADEDDEPEIEAPRVAPARPGRNDPCWCGSGKKYKKCHLAEDEQAARPSPKPVLVGGKDAESSAALSNRLTRALLDSLEGRSRADFDAANRMYFGDYPPDVDDPNDDIGPSFMEWYAFSYRARGTGRTAVEEYLRRNGPRLSSRERAMFEAFRNARFGLLEVERLDPGTGVEVKDVFAGDTMFIHDVSSSKALVRWDCTLSRIYEFEGKWFFAGAGTVVPRSMVPSLREAIDRERKKTGQTAAEFVQTNDHRIPQILSDLRSSQMAGLALRNAEGDELEFSSATYEVRDDTAALAALRSIPDLEDNTKEKAADREHEFVWLEAGDADGRRIYGRMELRPGRLRLECNSRRRLKRGREIIEDAMSAYVRHLGDAFESMAALKRRAASSKSTAPPADDIPEDVKRELLLNYKQQHYATWPDEKLPALAGKTPRQAVKTVAGRTAVRDLLRDLDNHEQRAAQHGDPVYDFNKLRRELGLEEE